MINSQSLVELLVFLLLFFWHRAKLLIDTSDLIFKFKSDLLGQWMKSMNKPALHKQRITPRRYNLEMRHNYSLCRGWVYVCMPPQCAAFWMYACRACAGVHTTERASYR